MKIRKAVFPVAGLGTRVLPATKAMPKEMLTIVDKPLIQYVVDEAREAGIEHFVFVTGRNKVVIEDHFDRMYELDATLQSRGKKAEMEILARDQPSAGAMREGASRVAVAPPGAQRGLIPSANTRTCSSVSDPPFAEANAGINVPRRPSAITRLSSASGNKLKSNLSLSGGAGPSLPSTPWQPAQFV